MVRVACLGEAMIEMSLDNDFAKLGVAGDTLNTAVYLKRRAEALQVDYVTRIGVDTFSDRIRTFIANEDLGIDNIVADPNGTPGLYAISLTPDGERSFTYWRSAAAARDMFADRDFSLLDDYDLIYLSGISMAILPHQVRLSLVDYLAGAEAKLAFDSNYRPKLWSNAEAREITSALWEICDIPMPSIDDEMELFGENAETVERRCAKMTGIGALKRGPEGPMSIGEPLVQDYPAASRVVDTTAAGDSFNGGYLAARLQGQSQADALMAGHKLAAHVIGHKGAIIPRDAA